MADGVVIDRTNIQVGDKIFLEAKEFDSEVSGKVDHVSSGEDGNITLVDLLLFGESGEKIRFHVGPLSAYSLKDIERPKPILPTQAGTHISANVHGHDARGEYEEIDGLLLIRLYPEYEGSTVGRWTDLMGRLWTDEQIVEWEEV